MTSTSPSGPSMINAPAILLVGKKGAGKSTLGNLLLKTFEDENPTFIVSDGKSVTKKSCSAIYKIGDEIYNIVDTPGFFDTDTPNEEILEEIACTVQMCAHGIKAILFVVDYKRYTEEQKNMTDGIVTFLGKEALQYMITVFSQCNKKRTKDCQHIRKTSWMGDRWAVSANPEFFPPEDPVHQQYLKELQDIIISLDGVHTNDLLEKARKRREDAERSAREADEKRQKEYDDLKRREGAVVAEAKFLKQKAEDDKKARIACEIDLKKINNDFKNRHGCFWLETRVKLESGRIIQMSKLQVGDRVLSNVRNGIAEFSDVYLIAHIGKLDHEEKFTKVSFTKPDGSKGQLRLTSTHYVFNENLSIMFAKNLRPGETKLLVLDNNNKLVPVVVDDVTNEWYDDYISFYTRAGSVIADGVLCSCYDHCPPSQALMDLVFLPIRWWTLIMPSTHREERLHPYVQFLETAYLSFVNAMKKGKRLIEN